jgi:hypothetical protein
MWRKIDVYETGVTAADLARAPGLVTVTGDRAAGRQLMGTLVGLLEDVADYRVVVAAGVLPGRQGTGLVALLDEMDGARDVDIAPAPTFLFCADPSPVESIRLRILSARDSRLRVIALGELTGACASLRVGAAGELTVDGFADAWSQSEALQPDQSPDGGPRKGLWSARSTTTRMTLRIKPSR